MHFQKGQMVQIVQRFLTWSLVHLHPALFLFVSAPSLYTCPACPQSPPLPASGSAPSAPAGSPAPPSPSLSPVCGSPGPVTAFRELCFNFAWAFVFFLRKTYVLNVESAHTYIHIYTHTHTHTHVGFYGLRGLSIGVMVFILYKLYVLLPYTYPTPKLSPHRRRCISTFPPKNAHCMIYKRFKLWGHWKCPHKSPYPSNTYVIPISLYKFVSS